MATMVPNQTRPKAGSLRLFLGPRQSHVLHSFDVSSSMNHLSTSTCHLLETNTFSKRAVLIDLSKVTSVAFRPESLDQVFTAPFLSEVRVPWAECDSTVR